jgi:hypothetical protein
MSINDSNVDLYAPSILQDFTYMFADQETMPRMIQNGSKVLIPMASYVPNNGIDSFDADGDGDRDALRIESEATLGMDIDGDGTLEPMDGDGIELSGDETIVLVLDSTRLVANTSEDTLQLFDHIVTLEDVYNVPGLTAEIRVCDNEGGDQACEDISLGIGQVAYFYRGGDAGGEPTFYIKFLTGDAGADEARVEVGRMFGQTYANIGANPYWSQKAFMVDCVLYNVVAIKAQDNCTKFITIRQKLPKMPIKLFGKDLCVWGPNVTLPELPPFNEEHEILVDILPTQFIPGSMQEKIGVKIPRPPLVINYTEEDIEPRFKGSLLEIYNETLKENNGDGGIEDEKWVLEWFHTYPEQYTAFRVPAGELYLMTLAWFAPEAETTIWNCDSTKPLANYTGDRAKFWYNPADPTDIYVTKTDGGYVPPVIPDCKGDSDDDGDRDFDDFMDFLDAYEKHSGETGYNEVFDFDEPVDGYIGFDDFMEFLDVYETSCP